MFRVLLLLVKTRVRLSIPQPKPSHGSVIILCGAAALGLLAPEALSQNFLLSSAARAVPNSMTGTWSHYESVGVRSFLILLTPTPFTTGNLGKERPYYPLGTTQDRKCIFPTAGDRTSYMCYLTPDSTRNGMFRFNSISRGVDLSHVILKNAHKGYV